MVDKAALDFKEELKRYRELSRKAQPSNEVSKYDKNKEQSPKQSSLMYTESEQS